MGSGPARHLSVYRLVFGGLVVLAIIVVAGLLLTRDPAFCDSASLEVRLHSPMIGERLGAFDDTSAEVSYSFDDRFDDSFLRQIMVTWSPTSTGGGYQSIATVNEPSGVAHPTPWLNSPIRDGSRTRTPMPDDEVRQISALLAVAGTDPTELPYVLVVAVDADGQSHVTDCQEGG